MALGVTNQDKKKARNTAAILAVVLALFTLLTVLFGLLIPTAHEVKALAGAPIKALVEGEEGEDYFLLSDKGMYRYDAFTHEQISSFSFDKIDALLQEKGERIDHLQNVVFPDLEEQLMKAVGIFKGKERKEINLRKQQVTEQLKNEQKDFDEVLFANGYTSINDFWEKYYEYEEIYYQYTNDPVDDNIEQNKKSSLEEAISNAEAQKASGTKIRTKSNHLDHER